MALSSRVGIATESAQLFQSKPDTLNVALITLMTLPVAFRRVYPVAVFVLVVTAFVVDRLLDYPTTLSFVGVVLVFHAIGTELSPRRRCFSAAAPSGS